MAKIFPKIIAAILFASEALEASAPKPPRWRAAPWAVTQIFKRFGYISLLLPLPLLAQTNPPLTTEFGQPTTRSITVSQPSPIAESGENTETQQPNTSSLPWQDPAPEMVQIPVPEPEEPPPTNSVILQGLNKVTGHISKLEGPIGTVLTFDNLEIISRRCWKSPADEQPENAALLEIREVKTGEEPKKVFLGWMFSSSPGLSGLEHPVYDVSIVSCEFLENPEALPEPKDVPAKEKEADKPKKDRAKTASKPVAKPKK